jgi:NAD(P)-dependent dehydrogenase (short-subunit alcohol dehydrogenase family)
MYNPFSLEGKVVLVTGASSGIGQGIAITCAKMGAMVVLNGRNEERLKETYSQLDGDCHIIIPSDLATQEGIDFLIENSPSLNGVVHSAGIPKICNVKHISRSVIEDVVNVNEIAPILLTSGLLKKKKIQKNASIVFISSLAGVFTTNIGEAPYATTKSAISGFSKSAAYELAAQGTRVNAICPGMVVTHMVTSGNPDFDNEESVKQMLSRYPLKRFGTPEDIANGVVFLLSEASGWMTGTNMVIDGGYSLA